MFNSETIAALLIGGLLALIIPIAAAVIFKLRNRETWLPSLFIGAGTFFVFAGVLEALLHTVMLPIVQGNTVLYCVYGALAAGIFEETGRFIAYKTLMKQHYSTKNAVFMGIGHGGCEAVIALGLNYISHFTLTITVNSLGGIDKYMEMTVGNAPELADNIRALMDQLMQTGFGMAGMAIYERIVAMVFHVCMSVVVYKAASRRGKVWLYPLAVVLHALLDVPAVLFQTGVITSIPAVEGIMTVFVAAAVVGTIMLAKRLPDKAQ